MAALSILYDCGMVIPKLVCVASYRRSSKVRQCTLYIFNAESYGCIKLFMFHERRLAEFVSLSSVFCGTSKRVDFERTRTR